jgi:glycolate oxidase FAD binding subunit
VRAATGARRPLRLRGSGSKDFYGEALEGEVLELAAWRGIVDYEPSELVITARCGTPLAELEQTLAAREPFLPFEPPAFGAGTPLGGVIAAGLSGPRRMPRQRCAPFRARHAAARGPGELLRFGGQS